MAFEGLTNKGREYMAKCLSEDKPITFVKVKIGNGMLLENENPETFTDIKLLKKEIDIVDKTQVEDAVRILVQIDNKGVKEGYFPREIGVYVQDGEQELLYWYINDGTEASWLPPEDKSPIKFKFAINLMATNLDTVIVNWTGTELWVDHEWLADNTTTVEEIRNIFSQKQFVYDTLELATEQDIRNLFTGTRMEGKAQFDLSGLSENEATIVNMRLLSLFNDLLQQRMNADGKALEKSLTELINTTKDNLQSNINLKANTSDVNTIKKKLEDAINLRATTEFVNSMKGELTNLINKKANQVITVTGGGALTGGGDLSTNRVINHKDSAGFKHIPSGGAINNFLKWSANGTAVWAELTLANLGIEVTSIYEIKNNFKK